MFPLHDPLSETLRKELSAHDDLTAALLSRRGITKKEALKIVTNTNPQKRIIPASEIAEMVAIICEGKISSLNGNPVIMTGGE